MRNVYKWLGGLAGAAVLAFGLNHMSEPSHSLPNTPIGLVMKDLLENGDAEENTTYDRETNPTTHWVTKLYELIDGRCVFAVTGKPQRNMLRLEVFSPPDYHGDGFSDIGLDGKVDSSSPSIDELSDPDKAYSGAVEMVLGVIGGRGYVETEEDKRYAEISAMLMCDVINTGRVGRTRTETPFQKIPFLSRFKRTVVNSMEKVYEIDDYRLKVDVSVIGNRIYLSRYDGENAIPTTQIIDSDGNGRISLNEEEMMQPSYRQILDKLAEKLED